jgi:hypothetical protein
MKQQLYTFFEYDDDLKDFKIANMNWFETSEVNE